MRIVLPCLLFAQISLIGFAQSGIISTVAGNGAAGFSGDGDPATSAQLYGPTGVAVDAAGNLYIADSSNNRIRKVTPGGVITTVAGNGSAGFSGDGGPATSAQLAHPNDIAVDTAGNLFIVDTNNNRIRKVTPGGVITTVAGNGSVGFSGDGGPATAAQLNGPQAVAVDMTAGNLFIADTNNVRIRRVSPGGVITTVAGNGSVGFSGDGGPATVAQFSGPEGIAVDSNGNFYISDVYNYRIRKVTAAGIISTVAGNGISGFSGDGGPATAAQIYDPQEIAIDAAGTLFIADEANERIRMVTPSGVITTVAGNGIAGFSGDGGQATDAQLHGPEAVAEDTAGNLFIADEGNNRIRKVSGVSVSAFFPQVAVGGGYSTTFTLTNTGSTAASGTVTLKDQQGNPLTVSGVLIDSSGTTQPAVSGSSFAFSVPSGGTIFLVAAGLTTNVEVGWAEIDGTGGTLAAVATYENAVGSATQSMIGVLQSQAVQYMTIPVDDDNIQNKQTAYAIANPSSLTIAIKLVLVGQNGTVVDDSVTLTLTPGQQISGYLLQDFAAATTFKGSLVLSGQNGATFAAVALVDKQGIYAVIPLISGKAPGIPN
jgi:sugar lactone lactonase YvrE